MESATRPTETVEDYLQLIYTMQREGTPVIAARIKERKGVAFHEEYDTKPSLYYLD